MDVALGGDNALGQLHLALGPYQLDSAGAVDVAGLPHQGVNPQGSGVGQGYLHLGSRTDRAKDRNAGDGLLRTYQIDLFVAGKLSGLGKLLLDGQLIAGAKQLFQVFLGNVDVTRRCFNNKFLCHDSSFLSPAYKVRRSVRLKRRNVTARPIPAEGGCRISPGTLASILFYALKTLFARGIYSVLQLFSNRKGKMRETAC